MGGDDSPSGIEIEGGGELVCASWEARWGSVYRLESSLKFRGGEGVFGGGRVQRARQGVYILGEHVVYMPFWISPQVVRGSALGDTRPEGDHVIGTYSRLVGAY